jgi:hypothetical protein
MYKKPHFLFLHKLKTNSKYQIVKDNLENRTRILGEKTLKIRELPEYRYTLGLCLGRGREAPMCEARLLLMRFEN